MGLLEKSPDVTLCFMIPSETSPLKMPSKGTAAFVPIFVVKFAPVVAGGTIGATTLVIA